MSLAPTPLHARPSHPVLRFPDPVPSLSASVIVPAKDEAEALPALVAALDAQRSLTGAPLGDDVEVLLLLNNCRDGSERVARRLARWTPGLRLHVACVELHGDTAHVGTARAALMDAACERLLALGRPDGLILSTDADSRPAPDWIAQTRREVARGADAVGGRARLDAAERAALPAHVRAHYLRDLGYRRAIERLRALYAPDPHDPYPRHHQHYGASLAVTAAAYARAGGMPPDRSSEDVALVHALLRTGARLRHSDRVRVVTSARKRGRAAGGLADAFAFWDGTPRPCRVETATDAERRLARLGAQRLREPHRAPDFSLLTTPDLATGDPGQCIVGATHDLRARAEQLERMTLSARLDAAGVLSHHVPTRTLAPEPTSHAALAA